MQQHRGLDDDQLPELEGLLIPDINLVLALRPAVFFLLLPAVPEEPVSLRSAAVPAGVF